MLTNPRDALSGQSMSPNTVPFHRCSFLLVCYSNFVPKTRSFSNIQLQKMSWPWNPGQQSLKVIESYHLWCYKSTDLTALMQLFAFATAAARRINFLIWTYTYASVDYTVQ